MARGVGLQIRLTEEEMTRLKRAARAIGKGHTTWAREIVFHHVRQIERAELRQREREQRKKGVGT